MVACAAGHLGCVRLLEGANVNHHAPGGETPMVVAATTACARWLIGRGARPSAEAHVMVRAYGRGRLAL
eukprot:scaffold217121_cov23-Tisochrysis_lutea.AAC.1